MWNRYNSELTLLIMHILSIFLILNGILLSGTIPMEDSIEIFTEIEILFETEMQNYPSLKMLEVAQAYFILGEFQMQKFQDPRTAASYFHQSVRALILSDAGPSLALLEQSSYEYPDQRSELSRLSNLLGSMTTDRESHVEIRSQPSAMGSNINSMDSCTEVPTVTDALYDRAISVLADYHGHDHIGVLQAYEDIANAYIDQDDMTRAYIWCNATLNTLEENFGADHLLNVNTMSTLASVLKDMERFDEAETLVMRVLKILTSETVQTQELRTKIAASWSKLASIRRLQGKLGASTEKLLIDSLDEFCRLSVESRENSAAPNYKSAKSKPAGAESAVQDYLWDFGSFLNAYLRLDDLRLLDFGLISGKRTMTQFHDDENVATALFNLGSFHMHRGDLEQSQLLHRSALRMRLCLLGSRWNCEVADSLEALAAVSSRMGNIPAADALRQAALESIERSLGRSSRQFKKLCPYVEAACGLPSYKA